MQSPFGLIGPFPLPQGRSDRTDQSKADLGRISKLGDTPCPLRVTEHHPQNAGRLWLKQGAKRASLGIGFPLDLTIDEHGVEGNASVPLEVEIGDALLSADGLRLLGEIGCHEHRHALLPAQVEIALELVSRLMRHSRLPVAFDFDHEPDGAAGEFGFRDDIDAAIRLAGFTNDGDVRDRKLGYSPQEGLERFPCPPVDASCLFHRLAETTIPVK